ncbi:MAG: diaminopimelate epimerase [Anaerovoracaceae bacterium]
MSGTKNDYIYFNCFDQHIDNPEGLAVMLSDRHLGIGGDGICLISRSKIADAAMELINQDGTNGGISGNALRCIAKYLHDSGIAPRDIVTIEAEGLIRSVRLIKQYGEVTAATVEMGEVKLAPTAIPVNLAGDKIVGKPVKIGGKEYNITCVNVGNPHCVVFTDNVERLDLEKVGPEFEHDKLFPERVNTEFVKVISPTKIKMRVWERGNGETWSCGTGACAAVVAAVENGYCPKESEITVKLMGGELKVRYAGNTVTMTGDACTIFEGTIEV